MLKLDNVTLVAVSSIKINENIEALVRSTKDIQFNSIKFISDIRPSNLPVNIEYIKCEKLDYIGFSRYTFLELWKQIDTEFCLLVHHDGYVLNPECWSNEFLNYDYIGAPWPYSDTAYITDNGEHVRVGNGGFCLRSKKMLKMPTDLGLTLEERQGFYNDDGNFCVYHRDKFINNGIKYAPVDVAARFSYENAVPENKDVKLFGFHRNQR